MVPTKVLIQEQSTVTAILCLTMFHLITSDERHDLSSDTALTIPVESSVMLPEHFIHRSLIVTAEHTSPNTSLHLENQTLGTWNQLTLAPSQKQHQIRCCAYSSLQSLSFFPAFPGIKQVSLAIVTKTKALISCLYFEDLHVVCDGCVVFTDRVLSSCNLLVLSTKVLSNNSGIGSQGRDPQERENGQKTKQKHTLLSGLVHPRCDQT